MGGCGLVLGLGLGLGFQGQGSGFMHMDSIQSWYAWFVDQG